LAACLLALTSLSARADEKPCRRNADGSVTCSEAGLKTLTDAVLDARAQNVAFVAKLDAAQVDKIELRHIIDVCRAELRLVPPPPDPTWQRVGYSLGVVGSALLTTAFFVDGADRRAALGGFGAASLAAGFAFVTW
jgi:hypothetical protein